MRAYNRLTRKRGFTLVELMIVVAIIGVLAALAIYGVRRYLASAKTGEAKDKVGAISRGATAAYERETVASETLMEGGTSTAASHALCANAAAAVPAAPPAGKKYQPNTTNNNDYDTGNAVSGWRCLKFNIAQPHYYSYSYVVGAQFATTNNPAACGGAGCYEAGARGDLDGDGTFSGFGRTGTINTTSQQLKASTQIHVEQEYE